MRSGLVLAVFAGLVVAGELTPGVAQTLDRDQLACLALNVYWEARDTAPEVQRSVAHVTLNRVAHPEFPDSICDVVHQGDGLGHGRCQFSCWCDGKDDEPDDPNAWKQAQDIARSAVGGDGEDPTNGALFFHNSSAQPDWAAKRQETARNGDHIYYK